MVKSIFAIFFFATAIGAFMEMMGLMGRSEHLMSGNTLRILHRIFGIRFTILLAVLSYLCIRYVKIMGDQMSVRAVIHSVLALTFIVVLVIKISIVTYYKQFMRLLPTFGMIVFTLAFLVFFTSAGFFLLRAGATGSAGTASKMYLQFNYGDMTPMNIYEALCKSVTKNFNSSQDTSPYPWLSQYDIRNSICNRISPPPGYRRVDVTEGSFAHWLRYLPLKEGNPPVRLYNGQLKSRQDVHVAVVDIDVGNRDLQQCADAIIRLRAEYLWHRGDYDRIHFNFLCGFTASYGRWRDGYRPIVRGSEVIERRIAEYDNSYKCFREYLDSVFMYANTYSLSREMDSVRDINDINIGDVFICSAPGGGICHAIIVVDMVVNNNGNKKFLLAQSYMPAQEIHILRNPNSDLPWYDIDFGEELITPEWEFSKHDLRRFRGNHQ